MASITTDQTFCGTESVPEKPCALLWDESLLWGVMAWRALREAGLPFDLIRAEDVRGGALARYRMIFVPGGWASNKIGALGERGRAEIRRFIAAGGSYLGICGGAGTATEDGLGLLPVRRKLSRERVPSFSGPILLSCDDHAIWHGIDRSLFCAWWPSQFMVMDQHVRVLARYGEAQAEAFSSDVKVADGEILGWSDLEQRYGILLDPARLRGEPAVLEGNFDRGKVILSLIHFDTPGDRNGAIVLRNIWRYLASCSPSHPSAGCGVERDWHARISRGGSESTVQHFQGLPPRTKGGGFAARCGELQAVEEIQAAVADLIATGAESSLWSWRNPLLLQWRRGIRGLEYSTLAVMIDEIARCLRCPGVSVRGNVQLGAFPAHRSVAPWRGAQGNPGAAYPFLRTGQTPVDPRAGGHDGRSPFSGRVRRRGDQPPETGALRLGDAARGALQAPHRRGGPSSLPPAHRGMIAFEALLDDPGAPPLALRLGDEVKVERLVEVARRIEACERPEKDPAVGLPVAEGDRLLHQAAAPAAARDLRRHDEPAEVRTLARRLQTVDRDRARHAIPIQKRPESDRASRQSGRETPRVRSPPWPRRRGRTPSGGGNRPHASRRRGRSPPADTRRSRTCICAFRCGLRSIIPHDLYLRKSAPGSAHWRFFGYPAPAAQRPQRRLFEHEVRVSSLQRSEEVQGRKISSVRRDRDFQRSPH